MKKKMNILLYGNCQVWTISRLFNLLYKNFEIFHMTQVQEIDNLEYFTKIIPNIKNADFIITQNINNTDKDPFIKIIPYAKITCKIIFIDSLYASFYHPELVSISKIPKLRFGWLHDINIIKAFLDNISLKEFLKNDPFYNENFYNENFYNIKFEETIFELKKREKLLYTKINTINNIKHISIVPYLVDNYKNNDKVLFGDLNHPKLAIFKYLIKSIIEEMGFVFDSTLFDLKLEGKLLIKINRPVYASTARHLNLTNEINNLYSLGKLYLNIDRKEYARDAYKHYASMDDQILLNAYKKTIKLNENTESADRLINTKTRVLLYGNYQIENISRLLGSKYYDRLNLFCMTRVDKITDLNYFQNIMEKIEEADIIILQNVQQVDKDPFIKIIPHIKKKTKVIFIDSLYNSIFSPEEIRLSELPSIFNDKIHDINILEAYLAKIPINNFLKNDPFEKNEFYKNRVYKTLYNENIHNLEKRKKVTQSKILNMDSSIDFSFISIIPFIISNSNDCAEVPWGDLNHPRLPVYAYLLEKISKELNFEISYDYKWSIDTFTKIYRPAYKSTIEYYGINNNDIYYKFNSHNAKKREEFVKDMYAYYENLEYKEIYNAYRKVSNKDKYKEEILKEVIKFSHDFRDFRDYAVLLMKESRYKEALINCNKAIKLEDGRPWLKKIKLEIEKKIIEERKSSPFLS